MADREQDVTRQAEAGTPPLRKVIRRERLSLVVLETLECDHVRRFVRCADRRGVVRLYDNGRIVSDAAKSRRCSECGGS